MRIRWSLVLVLVALVLVAAEPRPRVRRATGAGIWYPADPGELRAEVEGFLQEAQPPEIPGRMAGCIVPHASYPACGAVAAHAFKALRPGDVDRVIVLAPSMTATFRGCWVPAVQVFETPLGAVPLDGPALRHLAICTLITSRSQERGDRAWAGRVQRGIAFQEQENAIEGVLPFLQVQLGDFKLVPVVVGHFNDRKGHLDEEALRRVAIAFRDLLDDRTLLVVCSNFTRYGKVHGYTPFTEDVTERIADLDREAFGLLTARDIGGFQSYLERTGNLVSNPNGLMLQAALMPPNAEGVLLEYQNTAERTGKPDPSISYAALGFFDLAAPRPVPEAVPEVPVDTPAGGDGGPAAEPEQPPGNE